MKAWLIGAMMLMGVETAALACSCGYPEDRAERDAYAESLAEQAVALVEAEALTSFEATRAGERMRLIRTLGGIAPPEFQIARHPLASSSMCDVLYAVGKPQIIVLFATDAPPADLPIFRSSSACMQPLLDDPKFIDALMRAMRGNGERG